MNKALWLPILFILTIPLHATPPEISVSVNPNKIGQSDTANIIIQVNQKLDKITPPQSADYQLTYRGEGRNSQVTLVNGVMSSKNTFSYTFVLEPKKEGKFTIGGFTLQIGNETYITKEQTIEVTKIGQSQTQRDPFADLDNFMNLRPKLPELYLLLTPNQGSYFVNEQIILDGVFVASTKEALNYQLIEASPLRFGKMILYDISASLTDAEVSPYGSYFQKTVKRYVLFPVEADDIAVAPPVLVGLSPYGQLQLRSQNIGIPVRKIKNDIGLPYIGSLSIKSSLSSNTVEVGKTLSIQIEMMGSGNLKIFSNPYNDLKMSGVYLSSPKVEVLFTGMQNNTAFFKQTITYSLLAQKSGHYELPPVVIGYYDQTYAKREITIPTLSIRVLEGEDKNSVSEFALKPVDNLRSFDFLLFNPLMVGLLVLSMLLPVGSRLYGRHWIRMQSDANYSRRFLADKRFSKYLKDASIHLAQKRLKEFYLSLQKGIFYYLTDKYNVASGLGIKELCRVLAEKGMRPDSIARFEEIYNECNQNAYSGVADESKTDTLLNKAGALFEENR